MPTQVVNSRYDRDHVEDVPDRPDQGEGCSAAKRPNALG